MMLRYAIFLHADDAAIFMLARRYTSAMARSLATR